jgi:hypothetical protein
MFGIILFKRQQQQHLQVAAIISETELCEEKASASVILSEFDCNISLFPFANILSQSSIFFLKDSILFQALNIVLSGP